MVHPLLVSEIPQVGSLLSEGAGVRSCASWWGVREWGWLNRGRLESGAVLEVCDGRDVAIGSYAVLARMGCSSRAGWFVRVGLVQRYKGGRDSVLHLWWEGRGIP